MSIYFNYYSFEGVVDNNAYSVSLEVVDDCFLNEVRVSLSNPLATMRAFGSALLLVSLREHTHRPEIHF